MVTQTTLGERLKDLRNNRKLRIEDVAKKVDISRSVLSCYENDKQLPGYEILGKLADFYNVSLDYIFGKVANPKRENINIGERIGLSDTAIATIEAHKQIEIPIDSGLLNIPLVLNSMLENEQFCSTFFPNFLKYFDKTACHNIFRSIVENGIVDESTDERSLFYVGMTRALDRLLQDISQDADTSK